MQRIEIGVYQKKLKLAKRNCKVLNKFQSLAAGKVNGIEEKNPNFSHLTSRTRLRFLISELLPAEIEIVFS